MGQCLFRILLEQMLGSRSSKNGHSLSNKRRKKRQMYNTMFFSLHVGTDEKNNGIIRRNKKKVEWPTTTSHKKKKRDLERLQKFVATPPPIWIGKNGHTHARLEGWKRTVARRGHRFFDDTLKKGHGTNTCNSSQMFSLAKIKTLLCVCVKKRGHFLKKYLNWYWKLNRSVAAPSTFKIFFSVYTLKKKKNPGGIPHFPLSINNAREGGGGGDVSLLFFQVFIISISFSHLFLLSLARTHQVICAICKGEAILPQRSQRQHTTLPPSLKIWCFLLWPINEKCPLSYSKRKKGQWQKKIRNKNSQRSPLYIFFLSERKEDDAIFFFYRLGDG